jgi:hypothetical protein
MMDKLPKSEAWKQNDPDRSGLLLHPRYEQRLSIRIHRIREELPHSSKLEPRNPVRPRRILAQLSRSSYDEGFQQARRPSEPCHSPDKATPSYYTKKGSFASGISKMWCMF